MDLASICIITVIYDVLLLDIYFSLWVELYRWHSLTKQSNEKEHMSSSYNVKREGGAVSVTLTRL